MTKMQQSEVFVEKVFIGLDHAPPGFDLRTRILGQNGANLEFIRNDTGAVVILKGGMSDKFEPLHIFLQHQKQEAIDTARSLAVNLVETVKQELEQWTASQATPLNVPPPSIIQSHPPPQILQSNNPPQPVNTVQGPLLQPFTPQTQVVPIAPAVGTNPTVLSVRPQYIQLLPQQQVILAPMQDGTHQYVITQPGNQIMNPGNQILGGNVVDMSNLQFRLGGAIPSFIQNGLAMSQINQPSEQQQQAVLQNVEKNQSGGTPAPAQHLQPQQMFIQTANGSLQQIIQDKPQDAKDQVQWVTQQIQTPLYTIPYQYQQNTQQPQQIILSQQGLPNSLSNMVWQSQPNNATGLDGTVVPLQLCWNQATSTHTITTPQAQIQPWQVAGQPQASTNQPNSSIATTVWSTNARPQPALQNIAAKPPTQQNNGNKNWQQTSTTQTNQQENRGVKRNLEGQTPLRAIAPAGSPNDQRTQNQSKSKWTGQQGSRSSTPMNAGQKNQHEVIPANQTGSGPPKKQNLPAVQQNSNNGSPKYMTYDQMKNESQTEENDDKQQDPSSSPNIPAYIIPRNIEPAQGNQFNVQPPSSGQQSQIMQQFNQVPQMPSQQFNNGNVMHLLPNAQISFIPNQSPAGTQISYPPQQTQHFSSNQQFQPNNQQYPTSVPNVQQYPPNSPNVQQFPPSGQAFSPNQQQFNTNQVRGKFYNAEQANQANFVRLGNGNQQNNMAASPRQFNPNYNYGGNGGAPAVPPSVPAQPLPPINFPPRPPQAPPVGNYYWPGNN